MWRTPAVIAWRSSSTLLLLPCKTQPIGGHAGRQRDVQLAAGGDVEQQPLLVGEPGHRPAQERLGGVHDTAAAERRDRLAAAGAQVRLVVDEQRRAELVGEVGERATADAQPAVVTDRGRVGQQAERDRRGHG